MGDRDLRVPHLDLPDFFGIVRSCRLHAEKLLKSSLTIKKQPVRLAFLSTYKYSPKGKEAGLPMPLVVPLLSLL